MLNKNHFNYLIDQQISERVSVEFYPNERWPIRIYTITGGEPNTKTLRFLAGKTMAIKLAKLLHEAANKLPNEPTDGEYYGKVLK